MSAKTTQLLSSGQFYKLRYDTIPVKWHYICWKYIFKRYFLCQILKYAKFWVVALLSQMSDIWTCRVPSSGLQAHRNSEIKNNNM